MREMVPAEPFARIIKRRIEVLKKLDTVDPVQDVSRETGVVEQIVYKLRRGNQKRISFNNADKIVTKLIGPMSWHTDPELNEIYLNTDLDKDDEESAPEKPPAPEREPNHGTRNEYVTHRCRCVPCTKANRDYIRKYLRRRAVAA